MIESVFVLVSVDDRICGHGDSCRVIELETQGAYGGGDTFPAFLALQDAVQFIATEVPEYRRDDMKILEIKTWRPE